MNEPDSFTIRIYNLPFTMPMTNSTPPLATKKPFTITTHGHERIDDYFWLREKTNPDVLAHLEAENAYMETQTAHLADLRETLYNEMVGRIKETDDSVPLPYGDYFYYTRTEQGKQYSIYCRKFQSLEADEQVLIDLNAVNDENDYPYLRMGVYEISPDHKLLAFGLDTTGAETYTIRFKVLETGELLDDVIEGAAGSAEWGDNNTFFYTTEQEGTKRSHKLHRHTLGTVQADDALLYHETDELFSVYVSKTRDERYLFLAIYSIESYEFHFLDASTPFEAFTIVEPRTPGLRYDVDHRDGTFYLVTNADNATNSKLVTAPVTAPGRANWTPMVAHREDVRLYSVELFSDYMVRYERANGLTQLVVYTFETDDEHIIDFPEPVYYAGVGSNANFESDIVRITYTSMVTPASTYDYNMASRERELKKQQPVLGGFESSDYTTERIFASAEDGKQVPISLVYRKDAWDGTPTTLHLYGYGSYGMTIDPTFSSSRVSLLDRGIVFAIAHVRGSQMLGRQWYDDGKFLNKRNTFTDFIACAKHLIALNYTAPDKMSMEGRSAGGLLMGAVLNMAPTLFKAAIAGVPFVDVVSTMLDETIPLTVGEFDEWGNPKDPEYYDYMLSYSPYDNVVAQDYPAILATAGLNDPRVAYWEPAKWVAKLRVTKTDDNPLLLKMQMGAGHFASSGRYDYLKDVAFDYAFLIDQLGVG